MNSNLVTIALSTRVNASIRQIWDNTDEAQLSQGYHFLL
jgi:hypothetical protein